MELQIKQGFWEDLLLGGGFLGDTLVSVTFRQGTRDEGQTSDEGPADA
jgi:hypothetical protein